MLYDRWREIARERSDQIALVDVASGQCHTFRELARLAEQGGHQSKQPTFPQGLSPRFILSVLDAWRRRTVACPLEEGQKTRALEGLPSDCVHLKTTSASTGLPRLVAFNAHQLAADADQIVSTMGLRPDWPNLATISLAHSYGFSNLVLPLLLHGVPLILANSPLPECVRRAAEHFPEITLPAVPALWRTWLDAGGIPPNVRLAISAGAPLPLSLELAVFERCHLKIHNFYGATECGGIAYDRTTQPRSDAACVGSSMDKVTLSLDGGCLCVQSAAVGLTYWPQPAPALSAGVYCTSDLAELVNGTVYLRGRQTDQINVAGRKVSPESIERALATHPAVSECLVFGAPSPDQDRTDIIVACVACRSDTTPATLKQHLLAQLPSWQIPRDWWFVPNLKASQRGKISRSDWQRKYLSSKRP